MLERSFRIYCLVWVSLVHVILLGSCASGPKVDLCISDPHHVDVTQVPNPGMDCVSPDKKDYFKPYSETENYVCLSPNDARTLFEFCRKGDR